MKFILFWALPTLVQRKWISFKAQEPTMAKEDTKGPSVLKELGMAELCVPCVLFFFLLGHV